MSTRFLHTADWQLGKPFAGIGDLSKRVMVQQERINAIERIGRAAADHGAEFILVAGDLFDSLTPTKDTVAAACSAIGRMGLPVLAIPGNHDHGGPGSVWEQRFFQVQREALAPNFQILLKPEPVEVGSAVIFPCPLLRRAEAADPTAWLHGNAAGEAFGSKARIALAHGSIQGFGSQADEEDSGGVTNQISLAALDTGAFDYIALGDWHGTKRAGSRAWYAGTPELDRFPKGESNEPGHVLAVSAARGQLPEAAAIRTARFGWHELAFDFADDASLAQLRQRLGGLIQSRAGEDLLQLELTGSLGIAAANQLEDYLEALGARLLRLKLANLASIAPTAEEIQALTQRVSDPLIARVATQLTARAAGSGEDAIIARTALRELHAACLAN